MSVLFQCKFCDKHLSTNYNLTKHCRNVHNVEFVHDKPFKCAICKNSYSCKKNLIVHLRKKHGLGKCKTKQPSVNEIKTCHLKCTKCGELYLNLKQLRHHLVHIHKIKIKSTKITFENRDGKFFQVTLFIKIL